MGGMPPPTEDLAQCIATAIRKKASKLHVDKSETVLVIDNRTVTYDQPDFERVMPEISAMAAESGFAEVWIYTGYCSDDDGNNAEFTLLSLKTTEARMRAHQARAAERGVDDFGRLVFSEGEKN